MMLKKSPIRNYKNPRRLSNVAVNAATTAQGNDFSASTNTIAPKVMPAAADVKGPSIVSDQA